MLLNDKLICSFRNFEEVSASPADISEVRVQLSYTEQQGGTAGRHAGDRADLWVSSRSELLSRSDDIRSREIYGGE